MADQKAFLAEAMVRGATHAVGNYYEYKTACAKSVAELQAAAMAAATQLAAVKGAAVTLTVTVVTSDTHSDGVLTACGAGVGAALGAAAGKVGAAVAANMVSAGTAGTIAKAVAACSPWGWALLGAVALGCLVAAAVHVATRQPRTVTVTVSAQPPAAATAVKDTAGRAVAC